MEKVSGKSVLAAQLDDDNICIFVMCVCVCLTIDNYLSQFFFFYVGMSVRKTCQFISLYLLIYSYPSVSAVTFGSVRYYHTSFLLVTLSCWTKMHLSFIEICIKTNRFDSFSILLIFSCFPFLSLHLNQCVHKRMCLSEREREKWIATIYLSPQLIKKKRNPPTPTYLPSFISSHPRRLLASSNIRQTELSACSPVRHF